MLAPTYLDINTNEPKYEIFSLCRWSSDFLRTRHVWKKNLWNLPREKCLLTTKKINWDRILTNRKTCSFHLRNGNSNKELKIQLEDIYLEHSKFPEYLGVTLDRSLTFEKHRQNTRVKVNTRNNMVRKLVNSKADANSSRTTSIVLSYSAAEYACL